jgi:hypothetical protein
MKAKILLGVLLCVGMLACEKQEAGTSAQNSSKKYQEVYDAMQQIIDKGAEYDITNVDALIVEGTGFWQLDALLGYTADYSGTNCKFLHFAISLIQNVIIASLSVIPLKDEWCNRRSNKQKETGSPVAPVFISFRFL